MFRHARQLDLARRLNPADRKERILISLESSREIRQERPSVSFSVDHLRPWTAFRAFPLLPLVPPRLSLFALPSNRPYDPTELPIEQFLFLSAPRSLLLSKPEAKGRNCFFSPTITSNGTRVSPLSSRQGWGKGERKKRSYKGVAAFVDTR